MNLFNLCPPALVHLVISGFVISQFLKERRVTSAAVLSGLSILSVTIIDALCNSGNTHLAYLMLLYPTFFHASAKYLENEVENDLSMQAELSTEKQQGIPDQ